MIWLRHALIFAFAMLTSASWAAGFCGVDQPCVISSGSYRVSVPASWDTHSSLPVAMFFHGLGGSAEEGMANRGLRRAFSDLGILLVFMDGGPPHAWIHIGARQARDEIGYTREVLADVRRRWPVQEAYVWVAGFSSGAFMVWQLACAGDLRVAGFVAISGAFLDPIPQTCPTGPVNLLEIHGLTDEMVPLEGRHIVSINQGDGQAGPFTLGDLFESFGALRGINGCRANPDHFETLGPFVMRSWDATCTSHRRLTMALHNGGHELLEGWVELSWDWIKNLAPIRN